jgi:hypothetical protein
MVCRWEPCPKVRLGWEEVATLRPVPWPLEVRSVSQVVHSPAFVSTGKMLDGGLVITTG